MVWTGDTFYYPPGTLDSGGHPVTVCHHRWPGEYWSNIPSGGTQVGFIQAGTSHCSGEASNNYRQWCFYFDTHGAPHSYWPTTEKTYDNNNHYYEFSSSGNTQQYKCYIDSVNVWTYTIDETAGASQPFLMAAGEVNFGTLTPQNENFQTNLHNLATLYRDSSGTLTATPHEDFYYAQPSGDSSCNRGWEAALQSGAGDSIWSGSGVGCNTGTAW